MKKLLLVTIVVLTSSAFGAESLDFCNTQPACPSLEKAIEVWASRNGSPPLSYRLARGELNGEPIPEAVVLLSDPIWCDPSGCTMLVFRVVPDGFHFVSKTPSVREPILLLKKANEGWSDLSVLTSRNGSDTVRVVLKFKYPGYGTVNLAERATPNELKGATTLKLR